MKEVWEWWRLFKTAFVEINIQFGSMMSGGPPSLCQTPTITRSCQLPSQSDAGSRSLPPGRMTSEEVRCLECGGTELPPWSRRPSSQIGGPGPMTTSFLGLGGEQHGLSKTRCPDFFFFLNSTFNLWNFKILLYCDVFIYLILQNILLHN